MPEKITISLPIRVRAFAAISDALNRVYESVVVAESGPGETVLLVGDERPHAEYVDAAEFADAGYLHEVNRRFLHPLGLKLSILRFDDGGAIVDGIIDDRDDPEGVAFSPELLSADKAANVQRLWDERESARVAALGYMVQPVA